MLAYSLTTSVLHQHLPCRSSALDNDYRKGRGIAEDRYVGRFKKSDSTGLTRGLSDDVATLRMYPESTLTLGLYVLTLCK